jgi:hypothetical protein
MNTFFGDLNILALLVFSEILSHLRANSRKKMPILCVTCVYVLNNRKRLQKLKSYTQIAFFLCEVSTKMVENWWNNSLPLNIRIPNIYFQRPGILLTSHKKTSFLVSHGDKTKYSLIWPRPWKCIFGILIS